MTGLDGSVCTDTAVRDQFEQVGVVFCYTPEDRERVRVFGVDSRIEVVSNGIDTGRFSPDGPESERVGAAGPAVLFVGRLVEAGFDWTETVERTRAVLEGLHSQ